MAQRTLKAKEIEMVNTPAKWPAWPLLPLRHRHRDLTMGLDDGSLGFLIDDDSHPPYTVYVGLMFMADQRDKMPTERYDTPEQLIADWHVD